MTPRLQFRAQEFDRRESDSPVVRDAVASGAVAPIAYKVVHVPTGRTVPFGIRRNWPDAVRLAARWERDIAAGREPWMSHVKRGMEEAEREARCNSGQSFTAPPTASGL